MWNHVLLQSEYRRQIVYLAGNAARDNEIKRIILRHLLLAIRNDEKLKKLLEGVNSFGIITEEDEKWQ